MTAERVGVGFDAHRFSRDRERRLVLGGVTFEEPGLEGHSDGDVVAHACADALLGAAGMGDIGEHFPSGDPRLEGADSMQLLARVVGMVREAGWEVRNVDCTVIAAKPRISHRRSEMRENLERTVGTAVHVKATTTDGMGATGRGEGVACIAVALLGRA